MSIDTRNITKKKKLSRTKLAQALRRKLDIGQANPYFHTCFANSTKREDTHFYVGSQFRE